MSSRAAELLGFTNLIDVTVAGGRAQSAWGDLGPAGRSARRALIRPEAVRVDSEGSLEGTVVAGTFAGARGRLRIELPDAPSLEADLPAAELPPVGAVVRVSFDPSGVAHPARLSAAASGPGARRRTMPPAPAPVPAPFMPTTSSVLRRRRLVALLVALATGLVASGAPALAQDDGGEGSTTTTTDDHHHRPSSHRSRPAARRPPRCRPIPRIPAAAEELPEEEVPVVPDTVPPRDPVRR